MQAGRSFTCKLHHSYCTPQFSKEPQQSILCQCTQPCRPDMLVKVTTQGSKLKLWQWTCLESSMSISNCGSQVRQGLASHITEGASLVLVACIQAAVGATQQFIP